jgi:hypothetical protein
MGGQNDTHRQTQTERLHLTGGRHIYSKPHSEVKTFLRIKLALGNLELQGILSISKGALQDNEDDGEVNEGG